ncbi:MAG TPA: ATP-binding protein [Streptosporangiaceae bacterium]
MAATRLTGPREWGARLAAGPAAPAEARAQVRAAIDAWEAPVDPATAVLLTSELVTNAIRHEPGGSVALAVTASCRELRVDVYDASCFLPVLVDSPPDAEAGRGLLLVAVLSDDWGAYRTPGGKAVYFTLTFRAGPRAVSGRG